jgi:CheY-like chemotaxis protein
LIDDSHEDLFLAKRLLVKSGAMAPIVTIDNGEQALAYLRVAAESVQRPLVPAIVFCDVQMPALDGLALLRCLRDEERLPDVPFYMLTGGDIEMEKARARELGAAGFLKKFPSPEEFNRLLAQVGLA